MATASCPLKRRATCWTRSRTAVSAHGNRITAEDTATSCMATTFACTDSPQPARLHALARTCCW